MITSPPGASVYIDGDFEGVTPATIPGLAEGKHDIALVLTGYTVLKANIPVEAGKTLEYTTGMTAVPRSPGFDMIPAILALGGLLAVLKIRNGKN